MAVKPKNNAKAPKAPSTKANAGAGKKKQSGGSSKQNTNLV